VTNERISLVLGSGGARGLAHIGAIRCLEDQGFEIGYIAGASIGALIGGIYAAGKLDDYAEWVCALERRDVMRLLDVSLGGAALFRGERIMEVLRKMVGEQPIEELPIGFTAVATEINDKREIWLNRGPLFDAIRASIAVPLVFEPVERDGMVLVDGGLLNPVPIAPTLNTENAWTIAIDLNGHAEQLEPADPGDDESEHKTVSRLKRKISAFIDDLLPKASRSDDRSPSAIELALRSMDTMQTTIARFKLAGYTPKLTIEIPRNLCTFFEFHRATELIDFGYRRTEEALRRADLR
jgi:NTE family protein